MRRSWTWRPKPSTKGTAIGARLAPRRQPQVLGQASQEELAEGGADVVPLEGQFDGGPQVVQLVAYVVAAVTERPAVHRLTFGQGLDGVRELDLASSAGLGL